MAQLKKKDKLVTAKLLQFGMDIDLNCAVFSKNIGVLSDKVAERVAVTNNRFRVLTIVDNVIILDEWRHLHLLSGRRWAIHTPEAHRWPVRG